MFFIYSILGIALKVANNQVVDDAVRSQYGKPLNIRLVPYCSIFHVPEILVNEREFMLSDQVRQWLADVECPLEYVDMFERHGYFKLSFIAGMTAEVLPCLYVVVQCSLLHGEAFVIRISSSLESRGEGISFD